MHDNEIQAIVLCYRCCLIMLLCDQKQNINILKGVIQNKRAAVVEHRYENG